MAAQTERTSMNEKPTPIELALIAAHFIGKNETEFGSVEDIHDSLNLATDILREAGKVLNELDDELQPQINAPSFDAMIAKLK
jgi:hypothetical protein